VKWSRAVHHLEALAETCADRARSFSPLQVTQLWAFGDILGSPLDLETVSVALVVDLSVEDVPWLGLPVGGQHWANSARLSQNPIIAIWRSAHAPIWNHYVDRPVLVWDSATGVAEPTLVALREGQGESIRPPAPTPDELRARLDDELAVCLRSLRERTRSYDDKRWSPGKMEPVADALYRASDGYLDILDALAEIHPIVTD
jgi:hypothetical protein